MNINWKNKIDISTCTPEDQVKIILTHYGSHFMANHSYEKFVSEFEDRYKLSGEGWTLMLDVFVNR